MGTPFKERLNQAAISDIATAVQSAWAEFPAAAFIQTASDGLDALELMARVAQIAQALGQHLPDDFATASDVLVRALGEAAPVDAPEAATREGQGIRGFLALPVTRWVADSGQENPQAALQALGEMTSRFSAEFDIRAFIAQHPEITWAQLKVWATDADPHRRRLASEGPRPYLPWGRKIKALIEDPAPGLEILEMLRDDPELYVRRSVANHLNDIARHQPGLVVQVARRWLEEPLEGEALARRRQMVRHALRGLLKKADPGALDLMGYHRESPAQIEGLSADDTASLGSALTWSFEAHNPSDAPVQVRLDYVLHRPLAKGKIGTRICHIAERQLEAGQRVLYDRTHSFKAVTTRSDYPGAHRIEVRINGVVRSEVGFEVVTA
ncbi:MAG: DNA alkylation repair protein [Bradymonadia bacterium]